MTRAGAALLLVAVTACVAACRPNMTDQPRYDPYEPSEFFADGMSARQPVAGTIARGELSPAPELGGGDTVLPVAVTPALLATGRERFDIYCAPCHGLSGDGDGMIVRRGFRAPPSLHSDRLRHVPPKHFVDVMTNGVGAMPPYGYLLRPHDRWAIAGYIQALQLTRSLTLGALPPDVRARVEQEP